MAVMQTPHGRVIGLILPVEDQPKVEASEKTPEDSLSQAKPDSSLGEGADSLRPAARASSLGEGAKVKAKSTTAKRSERTAKK